MKADRLKGLTDAVVAIVATIAVLELEIPDDVTWKALIDQWPKFSAHFISFFIIFIYWFNHNEELKRVDVISTKVFLVTAIWLSILSIVPFATEWVGTHIHDTLPELLYVSVLFLCMLCYQLIYYILTKEHPDIKHSEQLSLKWRFPIYIGFILAIVFSFIRPSIVLVIVALIILINVVEILMIKTDV